MKGIAVLGALSLAVVALAAHAAVHNDLAPYDAQGEVESDFWDPSGHASVAVSVGEADCAGVGIVDTRTYYRALSNILPDFRTIPPSGFLLIVR